MDDPTFPFIAEYLASLKKKRLANSRVGKNVDRNCFASGSGPNWEMAQMSLYAIIRLKIEALPETASKEDVLKVLDGLLKFVIPANECQSRFIVK